MSKGEARDYVPVPEEDLSAKEIFDILSDVFHRYGQKVLSVDEQDLDVQPEDGRLGDLVYHCRRSTVHVIYDLQKEEARVPDEPQISIEVYGCENDITELIELLCREEPRVRYVERDEWYSRFTSQ